MKSVSSFDAFGKIIIVQNGIQNTTRRLAYAKNKPIKNVLLKLF